MLFIPGDQFLSAALAERPDLIDTALKQSIIIATPSTLMALLKVVAYRLAAGAVTENAARSASSARICTSGSRRFMSHLQKVSPLVRQLPSNTFNASVGSMERNVLPQARKFTELGVTSERLPALDPIEQPVRSITKDTKLERRLAGQGWEWYLFHAQGPARVAGQELAHELVLGLEQLLPQPRLDDLAAPQDRHVLGRAGARRRCRA